MFIVLITLPQLNTQTQRWSRTFVGCLLSKQLTNLNMSKPHWRDCQVGTEEKTSRIARVMGPTWGPSGTEMTQVGPMVAQWTLLSGNKWNDILSFVLPRGFVASKLGKKLRISVIKKIKLSWNLFSLSPQDKVAAKLHTANLNAISSI